jgi:hypothetical protein
VSKPHRASLLKANMLRPPKVRLKERLRVNPVPRFGCHGGQRRGQRTKLFRRLPTILPVPNEE